MITAELTFPLAMVFIAGVIVGALIALLICKT